MAGEAEEGTPVTGGVGHEPPASRCPAACLPRGKSEARDAVCPLPWSVAECAVRVCFMGRVGGTRVFPNLTFHFHEALYSWRVCSTRGPCTLLCW